jgi:hypothetical protein
MPNSSGRCATRRQLPARKRVDRVGPVGAARSRRFVNRDPLSDSLRPGVSCAKPSQPVRRRHRGDSARRDRARSIASSQTRSSPGTAASPRWKRAQAALVFFDPDNGLEVASVARGKKGSSKYLYWDEVVDVCARERSAVLYQHFRAESEVRTSTSCCGLRNSAWADEVFAIRSPRVAFVVLPARAHAERLQLRAADFAKRWDGLVSIHETIGA